MLADYDDVINFVNTNGQDSRPRGKNIREVLGVTLTIPHNYMVVRHKQNTRLIGVETMMLLGGIFNINLIAQVGTPMAVELFRKQSDYGPRIFAEGNFYRAMHELQQDRDTRRAIVYMNDKNQPNDDLACTTSIQFLYRGGTLNAFVSMRSWDAVYGLPADLFMFSNLLQYAASIHKMMSGNVIVSASSLHIYEETAELGYQEGMAEFYPTFVGRDWRHEMFIKAAYRLADRESTAFDYFGIMPATKGIKPIEIVGL